MSDEPKACPSRDCKPIASLLYDHSEWGECRVYCDGCGVCGPWAHIEGKRPDPDAIEAEARRLWNDLPRATGPGEATRKVLELARETVKAVGLDPAKHVGCGYLCRVRLDLDDIAAALRECGMEAGS